MPTGIRFGLTHTYTLRTQLSPSPPSPEARKALMKADYAFRKTLDEIRKLARQGQDGTKYHLDIAEKTASPSNWHSISDTQLTVITPNANWFPARKTVSDKDIKLAQLIQQLPQGALSTTEVYNRFGGETVDQFLRKHAPVPVQNSGSN